LLKTPPRYAGLLVGGGPMAAHLPPLALCDARFRMPNRTEPPLEVLFNSAYIGRHVVACA
jgi:hypothetical protein